MTTAATGARTELLAEKYLQQHGLKTLARNFRCKPGEIDIIMQHADTLVFVEVRYRRNDSFGGALYSIDAGKRRRLLAAAQTFLQQQPRLACLQQRFDVVAMQGDARAPHIEWLQNAIEDS